MRRRSSEFDGGAALNDSEAVFRPIDLTHDCCPLATSRHSTQSSRDLLYQHFIICTGDSSTACGSDSTGPSLRNVGGRRHVQSATSNHRVVGCKRQSDDDCGAAVLSVCLSVARSKWNVS